MSLNEDCSLGTVHGSRVYTTVTGNLALPYDFSNKKHVYMLIYKKVILDIVGTFIKNTFLCFYMFTINFN